MTRAVLHVRLPRYLLFWCALGLAPSCPVSLCQILSSSVLRLRFSRIHSSSSFLILTSLPCLPRNDAHIIYSVLPLDGVDSNGGPRTPLHQEREEAEAPRDGNTRGLWGAGYLLRNTKAGIFSECVIIVPVMHTYIHAAKRWLIFLASHAIHLRTCQNTTS